MSNFAAPFSRAAATKLNETQDQRRETISTLILVFFLLIPLEGVLRKWVLNAAQQPIVFIRDPVLLLIYALYATWTPSRRVNWFPFWVLGAAGGMVLIFAQAANDPLSLLVYVLGFRNYFLYIPLAFVMRDVLTREDVYRYLRVSLWLSLPIAALVVWQFFSPPSAPINKGLTDSVEGRFLVIAGIVRPYGPFTFTLAQATFSALSLTSIIIALERRIQLRIHFSFWALAAAACFTMGALSGARTYFFSAAIVLTFYLASSLTAPKLTKGAMRLASASLVLAGLLSTFVFVFPTAFAAMSSRQQAAEHAEGSTIERAFSMLTSAGAAVERAEPLGVGIGAGSNAGAFLRGDVSSWSLGEYDWPRIIIEAGPVAGLCYIAFRIILFVAMFHAALLANRRFGDPSALIMFGLSGPTLLVAQITGQNQMLSFCWFACGMTLAMAKPSISQDRHTAPGRG